MEELHNVKDVMGALKSLYGKKKLFTCKVWKRDISGYCKNCKSRRKCLIYEELKKQTYRDACGDARTPEEVYEIQYKRKESWKQKISDARRRQTAASEKASKKKSKKVLPTKNKFRELDYIPSQPLSPNSTNNDDNDNNGLDEKSMNYVPNIYIKKEHYNEDTEPEESENEEEEGEEEAEEKDIERKYKEEKDDSDDDIDSNESKGNGGTDSNEGTDNNESTSNNDNHGDNNYERNGNEGEAKSEGEGGSEDKGNREEEGDNEEDIQSNEIEEEEMEDNSKSPPRRSPRLSSSPLFSSSPNFSAFLLSPLSPDSDIDSPTRRRKRTSDQLVIDQDLPQLAKRTKYPDPLERPTYKDFAAALQNRKPQMFVVKRSLAKGAGFGLYFNGVCKAGELMTGYGGERRKITAQGQVDSHCTARFGFSKFAMDATRLSTNTRKGNYDRTHGK